MRKYVAVGGVPGAGKSTVVQAAMGLLYRHRVQLGQFPHHGERMVLNKARGRWYAEQGVLVLGVYEGEEMFPGTDKLSMAVQPDALSALAYYQSITPAGLGGALVEGDRLYNLSMLRGAQAAGMQVCNVVMQADEQTLVARRAVRRLMGHTPSPTFLKGRATKIANVAKVFDPTVLLGTNTPLQNARHLLALLGLTLP